MKTKLVTASVYMYIVNDKGEESTPRRSSIGGKEETGAYEHMWAKSGNRPDSSRVVEFENARVQIAQWLGFMLENGLRNGESLHLVSKTDKTRSHDFDQLAIGEVVMEIVYDIRYSKGINYTADGAYRYKIIFKKA